MSKYSLIDIGLTDRIAREADSYQNLYLARVSAQYKDIYKIITANGEIKARISGKMGFLTSTVADLPVVGDWVMIDRIDDSGGDAVIHHIIHRHSALQRKAAGTANQNQIIAANIDTVFICMALNNDFNLRRLERYLSITWDSMATPVVVLTKSDLCPDLPTKLSVVQSVAIGADVLATTVMDDDGYLAIKRFIRPGKTAVFIGSSGVGKSTLINNLIGKQIFATQQTGDNDKGRHTTTHRQLIILSGGGILIDTPGLRELQIETADLAKSFADIDKLAQNCRFHDCSHQHEPGCAVQNAIKNGMLSVERLNSFQKLQTELKYQELNSRQLEREKINKMFGGMGGFKNARAFGKQKNKRN